MIIITLIFTGCGGTNWQEEGNVSEEEAAFVEEYRQIWEESLDSQNFSIMEPYYIINSHGYHADRRHHQELTAARYQEEQQGEPELTKEVNDAGKERIRADVNLLVTEYGETAEDAVSRYYYIEEAGGEMKMEAVGRRQSD
ncbi:hypothetical protein C6I21_02720 [Alkalicoccus urumqiensis]|uniref:Uncharacterized protein n=2 Tax=Alkalicoccus urumqiensis TaxID=1548213 RepID=A0A2P6MKP0_ALKUR|nr:hypothetical protein C6I21_02720 [Alkalicoccus urumqiensis]